LPARGPFSLSARVSLGIHLLPDGASPLFDHAEIISRSTRADAIADGVLIDVSATVREAGFRFPVVLTAAAWGECVAVPPGVACQDEAGPLPWCIERTARSCGQGTRPSEITWSG
jgi:hypothetical protein